MREVAVTEGDKVAAQIKFGFAVNGYGVGDLVKLVNEATAREIDALVKTYEETYEVAADLKKGGKQHKSVREAARIELGLRAFLEAGNFQRASRRRLKICTDSCNYPDSRRKD